MTMALLVFLGTFVTFALVALAFGWGWAAFAATRVRRLERAATNRIAASLPATEQRATPQKTVRRRPIASRLPWLDALLAHLPGHDALVAKLARTGYRIPATYIILAMPAATLVLGFIVLVFAPISLWMALIAGAPAGSALPFVVVQYLVRRRSAKFLATLPEAIDVMVRGLRSGLPVLESIITVGRDFDDPIGVEFRQIGDNVRLGRSLEDALWDVAERVALPEFNFLVISISVQRETGGNLAETLQNLSDILRQRQQMKLKIRALSSEARASAYIVGSLPFVMFGIMYLVNPDYISPLFTETRGLMLIGGGLAAQALGAFVMARMVRFEI